MATRFYRAFTLMELLVVIGILTILVGILIPSISHFRGAMRGSAITTFMGTIQTGLVSYGNDWRKDIPPSQMAAGLGIVQPGGAAADLSEWDGGELLAHALVAPLPAIPKSGPATAPLYDGWNGSGFNLGTMKTYGPYLDIKNEYNIRPRFDFANMSYAKADRAHGYAGLTPRAGAYVLTMATGSEPLPFLYFRAYPNGTVLETNIFSNTGRFDTDDANDLWPTAAMNPKIAAKTTELRSAQYLLLHAGADNAFGTDDDVTATGTTQ